MRIAFDLDDTLIPCAARFATEPPTAWLLRRFVHDTLREGAAALLAQLRAEGDELWVYTTSYRSPLAVRALLRAYGAPLAGVVNQARHDREAAARAPAPRCIKYPPAFGIDLLVDDSLAVANEGRALGYRVVHVPADDARWTARVVSAARALRRPRPA